MCACWSRTSRRCWRCCRTRRAPSGPGPIRDAYLDNGPAAGFAAFGQFGSWQGELTDAYFAQPLPPVPDGDAGAGDDPLLSTRSWPVSGYELDADAVAKGSGRVVIAVGSESTGVITGRTSIAAAQALGQEATVFPSHHGGFLGPEFGYPGQPEAFAAKLREVLGG